MMSISVQLLGSVSTVLLVVLGLLLPGTSGPLPGSLFIVICLCAGLLLCLGSPKRRHRSWLYRLWLLRLLLLLLQLLLLQLLLLQQHLLLLRSSGARCRLLLRLSCLNRLWGGLCLRHGACHQGSHIHSRHHITHVHAHHVHGVHAAHAKEHGGRLLLLGLCCGRQLLLLQQLLRMRRLLWRRRHRARLTWRRRSRWGPG
mmetsp:Transcript_35167/g.84304  ORF Transcript_35167/g.84304 Transcript_35167/m.84304 type:complete len:200 (-) Transcript_35167:242-841(-)